MRMGGIVHRDVHNVRERCSKQCLPEASSCGTADYKCKSWTEGREEGH
jgi:hypothetical protein